METALRSAKVAGLPEIEREVARLEKAKVLIASGEEKENLTDMHTVAIERENLRTWRASRRSGGVEKGIVQRLTGDAALARQLSKTTLTEGQRDAVALSLSSRKDRYVAVQGYAGTGKTFAMGKLQHYAEKHGYTVEGYAPSHVAVAALQEAIPQTTTLASLTTRERTHPVEIDKSKTIMVVDEASMISSREMRTLMDHATRTGVARVVFLGDVKQLDAVAAGTPFDQLQKAGIPNAVMDDIQRQRDPALRDAVNHAIKGEARAAIHKIGDNLRVSEDFKEAAAEAWLGLSDSDRAKTRLIALTNKTRNEMNETIREGLKHEGKIRGREVTIRSLEPLQFTRAEAADVRSYKTGDVVYALRSVKASSISRGETYDVVQVDLDKGSLILRSEAGGTPLTVPISPAAGPRKASSPTTPTSVMWLLETLSDSRSPTKRRTSPMAKQGGSLPSARARFRLRKRTARSWIWTRTRSQRAAFNTTMQRLLTLFRAPPSTG
ncbi:DUF2075 domain-containing protein [Palleronia caenipelagi]|uniref:DUF2075 domain-containing protein n=2 Tax=Palleronia caenipelagi TaxID=2489174 RepID=A0A547PUG7_9RHOB|nr:DUF2075 domain-containing protein [Palleronia caenipelagi]